MRYETNQTDWMIQVWDEGAGGFSDYWPVSTWSKSKRAGLRAAKDSLAYNRGKNNIPRFTIKRMRDKDITSLKIPKQSFAEFFRMW